MGGTKRWKVYDVETGEMFISRDVIFQEENFPFFASQKQGYNISCEILGDMVHGVFDDDWVGHDFRQHCEATLRPSALITARRFCRRCVAQLLLLGHNLRIHQVCTLSPMKRLHSSLQVCQVKPPKVHTIAVCLTLLGHTV